MGVASLLIAAEIGLRVWPALPPRIVWPTVEAQVKHSQIVAGDFDVVFLGSSVTEAGVDPAIVGFNSYNGALPFSSPISLEYWYQSHWPNEAPQVVILGMTAWSADNSKLTDPLLPRLKAATSGSPDEHPIRLLGERGLLADLHERASRARTVNSGLITDRGHQTFYYDGVGATLAALFGPVGEPVIGPEVRSSISALARLVSSTGGKFVIMVEPGRHPLDPNTQVVDEYLSELEGLAMELGVPFWDTYSNNWPSSYFSDSVHFNQKGTIAFSEYLRPLVAEALD